MLGRLKTLLLVSLLAACNQSGFKGQANSVKQPITRAFTQDSLPVQQVSLQQGKLGDPQTESFDQGQLGALDVLVVIDNSGSMKNVQTNLSTRLQPLLSEVANADWQVAVVTTDPADWCPRALIKKSDADATQRFQNAINAGTNGSGIERGISQAIGGLRCALRPWLRAGSSVAVLFVTDEDDCYESPTSGGYEACKQNGESDAAYQERSAKQFITYLSSIRQVGKDARAYGLLWHPSMPTNPGCATKQGNTYASVIAQTSGTYGSICDADFTPTLRTISQDVARIIKYEFDLAQEPDPNTIKITVNGSPWTKYDPPQGRKIKFTETPPAGAKVAISYRNASGGLNQSFAINKKPVMDTIRVFVNGQEVPKDAVKWNESTGKVELRNAPPEQAAVKIEYKEQADLKDSFEIGKGADSNTIQASVGGKAVAASALRYDANTGMVHITPVPPEASEVRIVYSKL